MQQEVTKKIVTIPNLLSLIRLLLLPVFFVLLVQYENNIMAFLVLLIASVTDALDGLVARSTHSVSQLGQLLDPFVDRIFIVVGIIAIFAAGRVPLWILIALLGRDACMLVLTVYQKRRYNRDFKVIFLGKFTTALVMAGFCSLVLWWPVLPGASLVELSFLPGWGVAAAPLGTWLLYVGVLTSWLTALIYLYRGTRPNPNPPQSASPGSPGSPDEFGSPESPAAPIRPAVPTRPESTTARNSKDAEDVRDLQGVGKR